jgi:hypothetical protein
MERGRLRLARGAVVGRILKVHAAPTALQVRPICHYGRGTDRAADAKDRAAQAKDLSINSAFENVAACWIALAEQVERIDTEKSPVRDQEIMALSANRHTRGTF